jgi:PQQ-dependent catabolism-associated beta-propeller protein
LPATVLQLVALFGWHAPAAFGLALASEAWHAVQHLCFFASALLFWNAMFARPAAARMPAVVGCLVVTSIVGGALGRDDAIAMVDVATRRVRGRLPAGPDPERFVASADGKWLYVANENDNRVSFVDIAARRIVREVAVGAEPEGMALSPDGTLLACTSETASLVHFIDVATATLVDSVMVGTRPRDALFSADGRALWVSSETRGTVSLLDPRRRRILATVDLEPLARGDEPIQAVGLALSRDGTRLYVAMGRANRVAEIDTGTRAVLRSFDVGARNWGVALSADGRRLFASNGLGGDVSVVDLDSGRTVASVRTGGKPWGVVVAP